MSISHAELITLLFKITNDVKVSKDILKMLYKERIVRNVFVGSSDHEKDRGVFMLGKGTNLIK